MDINKIKLALLSIETYCNELQSIKNIKTSFDIDSADTLNVWLWVEHLDDEQKETVQRWAMSKVGTVTKDRNGGLGGEISGLKVHMFGALKCEIIGYETKRRPIMTQPVETGEYEEIEVPVYDCKTPVRSNLEVH